MKRVIFIFAIGIVLVTGGYFVYMAWIDKLTVVDEFAQVDDELIEGSLMLSYDEAQLLLTDDARVLLRDDDDYYKVNKDEAKASYNDNFKALDTWELNEIGPDLVVREDLSAEDEALLPQFEVADGILTVTTEDAAARLELDDFGLSDEVDIFVDRMTDEAFQFSVTDQLSLNKKKIVFMTSDLREHLVMDRLEDLAQHLESDALEPFQDLLIEHGDFVTFAGQSKEGQFFNKKTDEIVQLADEDVLSLDGEFVYLNGNQELELDLEDKQVIQAIDPYLSGSDEGKKTFQINGKAIKKAAKSRFSGVEVLDLQLLGDKYVYYSILLRGPVAGNSGYVLAVVNIENPEEMKALVKHIDY